MAKNPSTRRESTRRSIIRFTPTGRGTVKDRLACEEPLEIQVAYGPRRARQRRSLAVTMRSPGADVDLALGFLFTEGIVGRRAEVERWKVLWSEENTVVRVELHPSVDWDGEAFDRPFPVTASCGICGKGSLDQLRTVPLYPLRPGQPVLPARRIFTLGAALRPAQTAFGQTGGMHAAALFDPAMRRLALCEDIGRHNALDKLIGRAWRKGRIPLHDGLVLLSGRVGFELVQKAAMAGIPVLAGVGAASSLAVDLAEETGMTLLGFLRSDRVNCYAGAERLRP